MPLFMYGYNLQIKKTIHFVRKQISNIKSINSRQKQINYTSLGIKEYPD